MAMTNRYPGTCTACGGRVRRFAGTLHKTPSGVYTVQHLACAEGGKVNVIRMGGHEYTQNARGRCEDAPCCGCCTI
jgi:hypothetical protein